jgi:hypothetical protein
VTIVDPSHPAAAGLTGTVAALDPAAKMGWGKPEGDVEVVATLANNPTRAAVFTYDVGARLATEAPAPGKRAGFLLTATSDDKLSDDGEALLFAVLDWATGVAPLAPNAAPIVDAGPDVTVESVDPIDVALAGSFTDDDLPFGGALTLAWSGPDGVTFDDPSSATATATLPGPGVYELTLAADDTQAVGSDALTVTVLDPNVPDPVDVLVVTATPTGYAHDRIVAGYLSDAGFEVTFADDNRVTVADTDAVDAVIITATVSPSVINTKLNTTTTPILSYELLLHDDLGLTLNRTTTRGEQGSFSDLDVVADHPITTGLAGRTDVFTKRTKLLWGAPSADAEVLATVPGRPDRAVLFVYETGDVLANGQTAAGARVGLFPTTASDSFLNPTGQQLLVDAVTWAVG